MATNPRCSSSRSRPTATRSRAAKILDVLEATHPEATCALRYRNAFELTVATILSAQCTDARVNQVTPDLFRRFGTAAALATASPAELEEKIRPTGFFRAKAKSLLGCAGALVESHAGDVPRNLADLTKLPGVGRKTANVILGHAYGLTEGIAVDTHVLRVSGRLGLTRSQDPKRVEEDLLALIPRQRWIRTSDLLIFHGRKLCDARRPCCAQCPAFHLCRWDSRQAQATAAPVKMAARGRRSRS